jgi:plastocyanin
MVEGGRAFVALGLMSMTAAHCCIAADLQVAIVDVSGKAIPDVVLVAAPADGSAPPSIAKTNAPPAIMDQINKEFVPEILVIRVGTAVLFPNSDSVAHQVYSFSPAKRFALPLYRGRQYPPLIFDQPGVITLGCNIHDHMVGYIVVTESQHFAKSDANGRAVLKALMPGTYRITAWHPRFNESIPEQKMAIADTDIAVTFRLTKPMQPKRAASDDRRIRDY